MFTALVSSPRRLWVNRFWRLNITGYKFDTIPKLRTNESETGTSTLVSQLSLRRTLSGPAPSVLEKFPSYRAFSYSKKTEKGRHGTNTWCPRFK